MGYYYSAANGFTDKRSSYIRTIDSEGKVHINGNIYINSIVMRFSANQQIKGYLLRGRLSIISPLNGKILQMSGKKRKNVLLRFNEEDKVMLKKHNRHEKLDCRCEFVLNTLDDEKIKESITSIALKLYAKHEATILRTLKELGVIGHDTHTALTTYIDSYIRKFYGKTSIKNQKSVQRIIEKVTAFFGSVAISDITRAMIKAYVKQNEKSARRDLNYTCKFFEFCRDKGVYTGENPLEVYADVYRIKKANNGIYSIRKLIEIINIPTDVEKKLNNEILNNVDDGLYIGLMLVKECNFTTTEISSLKWKNVSLRNDTPYLSISISKETIGGATHNYTRPLTPFAADVIYQRYHILEKKYTEDEIMDMPLASKSSDYKKPVDAKDITRLCRIALLRAGIDQYYLSVIQGICPGAGLRLLQKNLRYRLEYYCGLSEDPAAVSFLMGNSLQNDITADHYRSFISPEGQMYLYNALKRDKRFISDQETEENKRETVQNWILQDGITEFSISPTSTHEVISFKIKIQIKPNDFIYLYAPQGISCSVKVWKARETKTITT